MTFRGDPVFSAITPIFSRLILMKLIYLKKALKCDSFDVTIGIQIPFFRVSVTIEPGRSLLQFVTTNCLILTSASFLFSTVIIVQNHYTAIGLVFLVLNRVVGLV